MNEREAVHRALIIGAGLAGLTADRETVLCFIRVRMVLPTDSSTRTRTEAALLTLAPVSPDFEYFWTVDEIALYEASWLAQYAV